MMPRDIALVIGIGKAKKRPGAPPPFPGRAGSSIEKESAAEGEPVAQEQQEKASPMGDTDDQATHGMDVQVQPEMVCYKTEDEGCQNCTYNNGGQCDALKIPIGLTCNMFTVRESQNEGNSDARLLSPAGSHDLGGSEDLVG